MGKQKKSLQDLFRQKADSITSANMSLPWVKRALNLKSPKFKNPDGTVSTHLLSAEVDDKGDWHVFPTLDYENDTWLDMRTEGFPKEAFDRALKNNLSINFGKKGKDAIEYSKNGLINHTNMKSLEDIFGVTTGCGGPGQPPCKTEKVSKKDREAVFKYIQNMYMQEIIDKQSTQTVKPYTPQSTLSKASEIALNPLTAMGYIARNEDIPDNFSRGPRNGLDYAIDIINPAQHIYDTKNVIQGAATLDGMQFAEGVLGVAPISMLGDSAKKLTKNLKGKNKLNPNLINIPKVPKFKSEIEWSNWNKEIPENKALMQEYNAIEQQTKADGTWMKDLDGSDFDGPEELFIQSQSKNWVNAYGEKGLGPIKRVYRGMPNDNPLLINKEGYTGVFSGNKDLAKGYGNNLYELAMKNSDNSVTFNALKDDWLDLNFANRDIDLYKKQIDYNKKHLKQLKEKNGNPDIIKNTEKNIKDLEKALVQNTKANKNPHFKKMVEHFKGQSDVSTDDIAQYLEKEGLDNIQIKNVLDGDFGDINISNQVPGNYLKSLRGNNGKWDLSNPNMYKALIPTVLGVGAATQATNQKELGGKISWLDKYK